MWGKMNDKKVLFVLANQNFRDEEYFDSREEIKKANIGIVTATLDKGECVGVGGSKVLADLSISSVDANQFDAVIFIGGVGVEHYLNNETVFALVHKFVDSGKIVAAICWAPAILANAGVIAGSRVTAWSGCRKDLEKGGATYTGEPVTVDGNFITADGPASAQDFGKAIVKKLGEA